MKSIKIIATALIVTCAFEYALANVGVNTPSRVILHTNFVLRDTVPSTTTGGRSSRTTPMPTTPTTTNPMPTTSPMPTTTPMPTTSPMPTTTTPMPTTSPMPTTTPASPTPATPPIK